MLGYKLNHVSKRGPWLLFPVSLAASACKTQLLRVKAIIGILVSKKNNAGLLTASIQLSGSEGNIACCVRAVCMLFIVYTTS